MEKFKNAVDLTRMILVALLFIGMAFNCYVENYGMAIVNLLLIIIFELQNLNDKFKL